MNQSNDAAAILWAYEEIKSEESGRKKASLNRTLQDQQADIFLKLPFLAMEDTVYGKKERYSDIVITWKQYNGPVKGWVLLALIDTIEQLSKMIYEHYQALRELFKIMLKDYLNQEISSDIMGALAILKACRLDVILAEHYAKEGLWLMKSQSEKAEEYPEVEKKLRLAALNQWDCVRDTWGLKDEN